MTSRTPWHLWLVGGLALVWNAYGVWLWWRQVVDGAAYLATVSAAQARLIDQAPIWADVAYGLSVWAGLLGAMLLLSRRRLGFNAFVASLVGLIANLVYVYGLAGGASVIPAGQQAFSGVILAVVVAEIVYARWLARRGLLR